MKCGFVYPFLGPMDAIRHVVLAESHGWDGFFLWEPLHGPDAWVTLGDLAATEVKLKK